MISVIDGIMSRLIKKGCIKMKQVVHVIRKADVEKEYVKVLQLELDYELATLFDVMQENDKKEEQKCKKRLAEIHRELEALNGFA